MLRGLGLDPVDRRDPEGEAHPVVHFAKMTWVDVEFVVEEAYN